MPTLQLFILPEFETWLKTQPVSRLIKLVQNHHTYIPDYSHFSGNNHLERQIAMERFHLQRGFSHIAQHFSIFPDGSIMTGRPLNLVPAGMKGANSNGICLEHVGNFDAGGDVMNQAQADSILKVNALLLQRFGLQPSINTIKYHHWYDLNTWAEVEEGKGSTKSCPGTAFFGGNTREAFGQHFLPKVQNEFDLLSLPMRLSPPFKFSATVNTRILNVRLNPTTDAAIVTTLSKGTEVRVFEELSGWYAINSSRNKWVKKEYMDEVRPIT